MRVFRCWIGVLFVAGCAAGAGRRVATPAATPTDAPEPAGGTFVYVGLSSGEVATLRLDLTTGAMQRRGSVAVGRSPSSLVRSLDRERLVAVDEATGQAVALSFNPKTGALALAGRGAMGAQPTGATVDGTGKYVLAAHRGSGRVSVLALRPDGGLESIDTFAAGAGASAVALHPANKVAFVTNFRAGTVSQFTFNTGTGMLTPKAGAPLTLPAGSGPTRIACHPSGHWVYLLDETSDSISVHVFDDDLKALSALSAQIVSTLPEGFPRAKSRPGDLALGRGGRFLYATNRGHDSVVTFAVDAGGTLALVGHEPAGGRAPGALAVDPSGAYLIVANEGSKSLSVFSLDPTTGAPGARRTVSLPAAPIALLATRL